MGLKAPERLKPPTSNEWRNLDAQQQRDLLLDHIADNYHVGRQQDVWITEVRNLQRGSIALIASTLGLAILRAVGWV